VKIAIIGAGPSGLATAAVLHGFGHEVMVFEKAPDIGGVWSATRAYPGVATQDDRVTYAFSDVPMPDDFPDHPSGAQVRGYLEQYARVKGLEDRIHLGTRVESAEPDAAGDGWVVGVVGERGPVTHHVDWLVVANGVFSTPHVPEWPGREEFEALGGRVIVPTELGSGADLDGRRVVVVGWGKTACDVAEASSRTARSTTVVARTLRWKIPKRIAGGLTFRHLLLTRLGEHLMATPRTSFGSHVVAVLGLPARRSALWVLRRSIARRTGLRAVGMVPSVPLPYSDSLVTDGFFEAVAASRLEVRRERSVAGLGAVDGAPGVRLSDGTWLAADVVVPATGFDQELPFFGPSVRADLQDADGVLALHRRILPLDVPRLAFAGWGHTYRSPLTAEIGAVWLAGHLAGALRVRPRSELRRTADRYHLTHRQAAAWGEPQLPCGSFLALDQLLDDLELPLPASVRLRQWLAPLAPSSYAYLVPALRRRLALDDSADEATAPSVIPQDAAALA
jgi:cation diffusion facilitator CzcD-associated flavoprotein CzcO